MSKTPKPETIEQIIATAKDAASAKADELAKKLNKNVYPLVFVRPTTKEIFVGFISEPSRPAKMEAFDVMSSKESLTGAGEIIVSTSIIKEESHEAFYSTDSKYDDVYMSACIDSLGHVSALMNVLKKNRRVSSNPRLERV